MRNEDIGGGVVSGSAMQNQTSVEEIKAFRVEVDALIQKSEKIFIGYNNKLCQFAPEQVFLALIEAKMWLGKCLEAKGNPFPEELADKAN
jgi:hypothetical protein